MKATKKAFTLIEMLIVIVIIGILAAALIPRLVSVQGRARDTKRKADLAQIGGGLAVYKSDNNLFPIMLITSGANVSSGLALLLTTYLTSVPTDPAASIVMNGEVTGATAAGYAYSATQRNGTVGGGAALLAATETDGSSSNFVASGAISPQLDSATLDAQIAFCGGKATKGAISPTTCTASATGLRYYYTE